MVQLLHSFYNFLRTVIYRIFF